MLRIRQEKHLARRLEMDVACLRELAATADSYCNVLLLTDPAKPNKIRQVLDVQGDLRKAQRRIHRRILLPSLQGSQYSFGGVRGRHIKSNANQHLHSRFAFSCDITDFYPTIHSSRVFEFFADRQGCSPDVAHILTRLCTFEHHLALGLITSPLLADQFLSLADKRIGAMAERSNLVYTRYVDDITLSGPFDLAKSGFSKTINSILQVSGFTTNPTKNQFGAIGDGEVLITKLRVNRGHLDVASKYFDDLCERLRALRDLGTGKEFAGQYYTSGQMWGRVQFVAWVNPGRRRRLRCLFGSVPWNCVQIEARARGLIVCRKSLQPLNQAMNARLSADPTALAH